ncbi:MAG: alpha/beta hydrolase family protein [Cyclobacteriaceae bacterium]
MNMLKFIRLFFYLVISVAIVSCSEDDPRPQRDRLVSATSVLSRDASELRTFISVSGIDIDASLLQYDVEIFKIEYKTDYLDEEVMASGLVILPKTTDPVGMLSFQHGTIAAHRQAPTKLAINSTELILYSALAAPGFIGVVPDFLGFGSSEGILHPYYVEELTASAVVDMLKAAKELAIEEGNKFNTKLFLAGYSQGGYATMAAHKAIETNGLEGFELIASFPASGGYDIKGVQEYFFSLTEYDQPFFLAYVAFAYQTTLDWSQPLSDFFKAPYADLIPGLFDGSKSGSEINEQLTTTIADLVTDDLRANIDTDSKYNYIVTAFNDNSLLDWVPQANMYMYHGTADVTVPYSTSIDTYDYFIAQGASTNTVTFTPLNGATHNTGVIPYVEDFVKKLGALK